MKVTDSEEFTAHILAWLESINFTTIIVDCLILEKDPFWDPDKTLLEAVQASNVFDNRLAKFVEKLTTTIEYRSDGVSIHITGNSELFEEIKQKAIKYELEH